MTRLILSFCLMLCLHAVAEERFDFESDAQHRLFLELNAELRCPKCQNQNIADSNAMIAQDMKRKVHELVKAGFSKEEVIGYMKKRYGEFVHYQPPITPVTIWLYLLPAAFVLIMGTWLVLRTRGAKQESPLQLDKASLEKVESALKGDS